METETCPVVMQAHTSLLIPEQSSENRSTESSRKSMPTGMQSKETACVTVTQGDQRCEGTELVYVTDLEFLSASSRFVRTSQCFTQLQPSPHRKELRLAAKGETGYGKSVCRRPQVSGARLRDSVTVGPAVVCVRFVRSARLCG